MDGIQAENLTLWFEQNVSEQVTPPLAFELIKGGHSNLTYYVNDAAGRRWVLRRPPLGNVLESAHDMGREHRIISALQASAVPVPRTVGLCTESETNGAPFYVMDYVDGIVLHDSEAASVLSAEERVSVGLHTVRVLADLHAVDVEGVGLGELARRTGYVARQLKRWSRQWDASKVREVPEMDKVRQLLDERMPEQQGFSIVHGDYRLGNFLLAGGSIVAVLDWELCTLGDPLADVGYLLNNWADPEEIADDEDNVTPTAAGGFPDRGELLASYERETGRDVSRISYYRAFSYWRSAAINEGVYSRYLAGVMGNPDQDLTRFEQSSPRLAQTALELLESE